jgi:hypothetical protein
MSRHGFGTQPGWWLRSPHQPGPSIRDYGLRELRMMKPALPRVRQRVQLSSEGSDKLSPQVPMRGTIIGRLEGLVTVREDSGAISDYHPDFIEPLQAIQKVVRRGK